MARSTRYPGADLTRFYGHGGYSGIDQTRLEKIVLHSTETSAKWGCPGYAGGGNAPTFTINPWPGYRKIWQHFNTNESARALLNPSSTPVSENRDGVCQIEIIGYSDARTAKTYGYDLRNLTDDDYAYIGRLVGWIAREWDVPLVTPDLWPSYPASYGNSPARMTSREYDAFTGVLGHLHVSGNSHGDPTIDPAKIIAAAKASAPTAQKDVLDMTPDELRKIVREEIARVPAAVWAHKIPVSDGVRNATGTRLTTISAAGAQQYSLVSLAMDPKTHAAAQSILDAIEQP